MFWQQLQEHFLSLEPHGWMAAETHLGEVEVYVQH